VFGEGVISQKFKKQGGEPDADKSQALLSSNQKM
jgi:hypothetical protein